ncbi:homocysteine S-methyltransferase, partial [Apiospora sp. TS-2023a]
MTNPEDSAVHILDGGLGTSLQDRYGVVFDDSTPLWSSHLIVSDPDTLLACQRDFVEAGADVLLTATYQASIEGFARTKVPGVYPEGIPRHAVERYLANAVKIAERASKRAQPQQGQSSAASLALSLGPYGACMLPGQEYSGQYDDEHNDEESLYWWHLERLRLFTNVQGLMDRITYVAFETLPRLDEIRAVRRAYHDARITNKKLWISCVFPGEAHALPDGTSVDHAVRGMLEPLDGGSKPWGIGINCTKMHKLASLIASYGESVRDVTMCAASSGLAIGAPPCLLLYPDGTKGEVYNTATKKWEKQEQEQPAPSSTSTSTPSVADHHEELPWAKELTQIVRTTQDQGVFRSFMLGGCCKASAADISELRQEFSP